MGQLYFQGVFMKKLLYFFPVKTSFVATDNEILSTKYSISLFHFKTLPKWKTPFSLISQLLFIILKLPRIDIMFSQFSGYHTFWPALFSRIFNIPHYIVLNGTECNNFPEINYGYINHPLLFWFSKKSLQWSSRLLPVSEALVRAEYTYADTKYPHQGYTHFYKNINTPCTVIHNGISTHQFTINPGGIREVNSFVTVAAGLESANRRVVKGLDLVIELALRTPQYKYTFVGGKNSKGLELPPNITLLDFIPHGELSAIYNQHQYYLQLSLTEGFGISVCEAMLSGCVPIVSDVGVLPFIAGNKGYLLRHKNLDLLETLVHRAIVEFNPENSNIFRQHILDHFPLSVREVTLLSCIETG
jgi:glycosyltransferase involved in cell wall biosynthesis